MRLWVRWIFVGVYLLVWAYAHFELLLVSCWPTIACFILSL